ncbi:DNA polymerase-3 subunit epsilon [Sphaerotilus hippei]|uniref:DNA polymerase III subunit epsilon n=1 Tax=Sphaerotilus hippei TaxID=744406 RepID=A0A318H6E4_9BURK|nr:DNA polymerase III subunit epsilon [Sphaerotilus hippei]PXW92828.1 DNA polymerase-3 subunit epsilon [Sphaerotilus hippei]
MRQLFLDTETTGLYADQGDRVVEFGCVEFVNRRPTGNDLHFYFNPERPCHEEAVRVHGLTDTFLATKPKFEVHAPEIVEYLRGAEIVIHNAAFDVGFLDAEFRRLGLSRFADHVEGIVDTLPMARAMFPGKGNSLDALCRRLEVDNSNRTLHGALLDARLLAEVYIRLTRGQDALLMHDEDEQGGSSAGSESNIELAVDLKSFDLPVLAGSPAERQAHDTMLADLDKASGGKTIWRKVLASA